MQPTSPAHLALINKTLREIAPLMAQLTGRWLDESAYEDINDYAAPIKKVLPAEITLVKMNKRPFGFDFTVGTEAVYRFSHTTTTFGWKRVV